MPVLKMHAFLYERSADCSISWCGMPQYDLDRVTDDYHAVTCVACEIAMARADQRVADRKRKEFRIVTRN
jgi:hypothetical protein